MMPHIIRSKRHVSTHGARHPAPDPRRMMAPLFIARVGSRKHSLLWKAPPRMQTLEIEADAITRIENGTRICHVSPGENSNPHIHCDAPPKDMFSSEFPYLNGWVRTHYKQFKEQGDTLNSDSSCSEDDEISEDIPIQMRCDNPPQASPTVQTGWLFSQGIMKSPYRCGVCQKSFKYPSAL